MRREVAVGDVGDLARARFALLLAGVVNVGFVALFQWLFRDERGTVAAQAILGGVAAVQWLGAYGIKRLWASTWWAATVVQALWTLGSLAALARNPVNIWTIAEALFAVWVCVRLADPALVRTFARRQRPAEPVAAPNGPDWGFLDGAPYVPPPLPPAYDAPAFAPFVPPADAPPSAAPAAPVAAVPAPPNPYATPTGTVEFLRAIAQDDLVKVARARRALLVTAVLNLLAVAVLTLAMHVNRADPAFSRMVGLIRLVALGIIGVELLARYGMRRLWAWTWWPAAVLHGLSAVLAVAGFVLAPSLPDVWPVLFNVWVARRLLDPGVVRAFTRRAPKAQPEPLVHAPDPRFSWNGAVLAPGGRVAEGYVPPAPPPARPVPSGDYFG